MTMNGKPAMFVYGPTGEELFGITSLPAPAHVPREGEALRSTDHSEEGAATIDFFDDVRVERVESEFRLVENIGRGQSWQQIISVYTEVLEDDE